MKTSAVVIIGLILFCFLLNIIYEYTHTFHVRKSKYKNEDNQILMQFFLHLHILNEIIVTCLYNFFMKLRIIGYAIYNFITFDVKQYIEYGKADQKKHKHELFDTEEILNRDKDLYLKYANKDFCEIKTIYFIRHSESVWNHTFNRKFSFKAFLNILLVFTYELIFLFSSKSVLFDSPISVQGIIQSLELSNFLKNEKGTYIKNENQLKNDATFLMNELKSYNQNILTSYNTLGPFTSETKKISGLGTNKVCDSGSISGSVVKQSRHENRNENRNENGNRNINIHENVHENVHENGDNSETNEELFNKTDSFTNEEKCNNNNNNMNNSNNNNNNTNNSSTSSNSSISNNKNQQNGPYNPKEIINATINDHIDILNGFKYRSSILCSTLRRTMSTCYIGLNNRLHMLNENIYVLNSLKEICGNPDCISLYHFYYKYIATDIELFLHKDIEKLHKKNISINNGTKASDTFTDTFKFIFENENDILIIFGHSLWISLFFKLFLKSDHKAKTNKLKNSSILLCNVARYLNDKNEYEYEIINSSIRVIYKGFEEKKI